MTGTQSPEADGELTVTLLYIPVAFPPEHTPHASLFAGPNLVLVHGSVIGTRYAPQLTAALSFSLGRTLDDDALELQTRRCLLQTPLDDMRMPRDECSSARRPC